MMEAQKKRDNLKLAQLEIETKGKLGALQAIDQDEYEIGKYPAGKYATVDVLRDKYNKGGYQAILEHNERYPVPIANVDPVSKHFTPIVVEDLKIDKKLDYDISQKMKGLSSFKVVGNIAGTPLYKGNENSQEYKDLREDIITSMSNNPDFSTRLMASKDFMKFLDDYEEKTGLDRATLISEDGALPQIRYDYVSKKFDERAVNRINKGAKPSTGGGGRSSYFFIGGKDSKFTYTPTEDGYVATDKEGTSGAPLDFTGMKKGRKQTVGIINPMVKYIGNDEFEIIGKEKGEESFMPLVKIIVPKSEIAARYQLTDRGMSEFFGYKLPKAGKTAKTAKTVSLKTLQGLLSKPGYEGQTIESLTKYYKDNGYSVN
jgi:hypothetical protein